MSDGNSTCTGSIDRRSFLKQVEQISGGVVCGAMCGGLPLLLSACGGARTRYVTTSRVGDRLAVRREELIGTGGVLVEVPGSKLPVYVRSDGATGFTAVSTRCMHRGCQVEPAADRLACPCHGSEYTFEGEVLKGPTERPLRKYQVSADETTLYIHLSAEDV